MYLFRAMQSYIVACIIFSCILNTILCGRIDVMAMTGEARVDEKLVTQQAALRSVVREEIAAETTTLQQLLSEAFSSVKQELEYLRQARADEVLLLRKEIATLRQERTMACASTHDVAALHEKVSSLHQVFMNAETPWSRGRSQTMTNRSTGLWSGQRYNSGRRSQSAPGSPFLKRSQTRMNLDEIERDAELKLTVASSHKLFSGGFHIKEAAMSGLSKLGGFVQETVQKVEHAGSAVLAEIQKVGLANALKAALGNAVQLALDGATDLLTEGLGMKLARLFREEGIDWLSDRLSQVVGALVGGLKFPGSGWVGIAASEVVKKLVNAVAFAKEATLALYFKQLSEYALGVAKNAMPAIFRMLTNMAHSFWSTGVNKISGFMERHFNLFGSSLLQQDNITGNVTISGTRVDYTNSTIMLPRSPSYLRSKKRKETGMLLQESNSQTIDVSPKNVGFSNLSIKRVPVAAP